MSGHLDDPDTARKCSPKLPWETPKLTYEGSTGELIQGGGGKSGVSADPGDPAKPPGQS